jgi:hypothetical protein
VGPIESPETTLRRVKTQKTEEFSSTAAEDYDLAENNQHCLSPSTFPFIAKVSLEDK